MINSHSLGEQHDATFRGTVCYGGIATNDSPARTVVNNHAAALCDHARQCKFRHQKRAFQIDVNLQVPLFFGTVKRCMRIENASVVEKDV